MDVNRSLTARFRFLSINNSTSVNFQISQISLPFRSRQKALNRRLIGKLPNKHGRALAVNHVQNLTNRKAFRQRKDNYARTLEIRTSDLEMLYNSAQNEIKSLKDRIMLLEKKLTSSGINEIIMNDASQIEFNGNSDNSLTLSVRK
ncbi:hypothetical protein C1645_784375 [Glomus cerebriforme]|uniref:BZIP domain-containing protein n=1 Tax=Glomus cerebriforme TaxID=658196 RepID=A0A397SI39_9GLOM|nr:hypothetical protein C1645_784375 [Glomus cerebriforme]